MQPVEKRDSRERIRTYVTQDGVTAAQIENCGKKKMFKVDIHDKKPCIYISI